MKQLFDILSCEGSINGQSVFEDLKFSSLMMDEKYDSLKYLWLVYLV